MYSAHVGHFLQENDESTPEAKRRKTAGYALQDDIKKLIEQDKQNSKLWKECKLLCLEGRSVSTQNKLLFEVRTFEVD